MKWRKPEITQSSGMFCRSLMACKFVCNFKKQHMYFKCAFYAVRSTYNVPRILVADLE
jgi:hypothetical protein